MIDEKAAQNALLKLQSGHTQGIRENATSQESKSWYEAMASAWGETLDNQAQKITELSSQVGTGDDQPSQIVQLTAESLRMQFLSNQSATANNSVGQALESIARKQ